VSYLFSGVLLADRVTFLAFLPTTDSAPYHSTGILFFVRSPWPFCRTLSFPGLPLVMFLYRSTGRKPPCPQVTTIETWACLTPARSIFLLSLLCLSLAFHSRVFSQVIESFRRLRWGPGVCRHLSFLTDQTHSGLSHRKVPRSSLFSFVRTRAVRPFLGDLLFDAFAPSPAQQDEPPQFPIGSGPFTSRCPFLFDPVADVASLHLSAMIVFDLREIALVEVGFFFFWVYPVVCLSFPPRPTHFVCPCPREEDSTVRWSGCSHFFPLQEQP